MLEVKRLTRYYGDLAAVDKVDFSIDKGEIVGLLGHNGAGKTTIMRMLSGCLEPNHGSIKVNHIDLSLAPKKVQQYLGYLPENLPIYPEMTVANYLDYAASLKGLVNEVKQKEIRRVIGDTNLQDKLLTPIGKLSRGYKQRTGVAQAILGKPKLLILDEPTNGLDPSQTGHMRQLIRDLAKQATIILSTHIMQEVDAVCHRVLILHAGKLAVDAKLDQLRQANHLLLTTSMTAEIANQKLRPLEGVRDLERIDEGQTPAQQPLIRYRVTLAETQALETISNTIAHTIINHGDALFGLQAEYQDLEALLRQVNITPGQSEKEAHHAA